MARAEFITYTPGEIEAIGVLNAHKGEKLSAKALNLKTATLTSLIKKANDERPMADGVDRVVVNKEQVTDVCPTCGAEHTYMVYWID